MDKQVLMPSVIDWPMTLSNSLCLQPDAAPDWEAIAGLCDPASLPVLTPHPFFAEEGGFIAIMPTLKLPFSHCIPSGPGRVLNGPPIGPGGTDVRWVFARGLQLARRTGEYLNPEATGAVSVCIVAVPVAGWIPGKLPVSSILFPVRGK